MAKGDRKFQFERVAIPRTSYRPGDMTPEQQAAMNAAALKVLEAYKPLAKAIEDGLVAQAENCGKKSHMTWMQSGAVYREVKNIVQQLSPDVVFPAFGSLKETEG